MKCSCASLAERSNEHSSDAGFFVCFFIFFSSATLHCDCLILVCCFSKEVPAEFKMWERSLLNAGTVVLNLELKLELDKETASMVDMV